MTLPELYTLTDVVEATGMSERWLRQRIKDGAVHTRLGTKIRFTEEQYHAFVAEHAQAPAATSITTGRRKRA